MKLTYDDLTGTEKEYFSANYGRLTRYAILRRIEQVRVRRWISERKRDGTLPGILHTIEQKEAEKARLLREEENQKTIAKYEASRFPVVLEMPKLDLGAYPCIVGFRQWSPGNFGLLRSESQGYEWKTLNFADKVPTENNSHGFYAMSLDAISAMSGMRGYFNGTDIFGFVALYGKVVKHSDGTLRAEVAKVLSTFVTAECRIPPSLFIRRFVQRYPTVPIYARNQQQIAEMVFWEAAKQMLRNRGEM